MHDELREAVHRLQLTIAIDGPAGAGKSTVGRGLAELLACRYLDTGIMYRAVTLTALRTGIRLDEVPSLVRIAGSLDFSWAPAGTAGILVEGEPPRPELRSAVVDAAVSEVSAHPAVRQVLVERQRALARSDCVVMVGRDIGTVVLPDAPVKLWITASPDVRARRREAEEGFAPADMARRLYSRDQIDSGRAVSPALPAEDATILETDGLSPSGSVNAALGYVRAAVERAQASAH